MAYEINQRTEADYRWFRFEAPTELLDALDHNLKIADGVLRFRIFKVDPDAPVIGAARRGRASAAPASAGPREAAAAAAAAARAAARIAASSADEPPSPADEPPSSRRALATAGLAASLRRLPPPRGRGRAARALRLESRQANSEE